MHPVLVVETESPFDIPHLGQSVFEPDPFQRNRLRFRRLRIGETRVIVLPQLETIPQQLGVEQLLMLLLVMDPQFNDALDILSGSFLQHTFHHSIEIASILQNFGHGNFADQDRTTTALSDVGASALVIGIEVIPDPLVALSDGTPETSEHDHVEKPGRVTQVPRRRAHLGRGLVVVFRIATEPLHHLKTVLSHITISRHQRQTCLPFVLSVTAPTSAPDQTR